MNDQQQNLMHISSPNIGYMDSLQEYQKLEFNNRIGEYLKTNSINSKISTTIYIKTIELDKVWQKLQLKYELFTLNTQRVIIVANNFLAELWWQYSSSHIGIGLNVSAKTILESIKYIDEIKLYLKEFLISESTIEYTVLQYENAETLNETFYHDTLDIEFNPLAVPFIDDVDSYIENFLNSKAPILILQGEPGTGKTTFSKHILSKMKDRVLKTDIAFKALYSFDENIFAVSDFYKRIIYDEYDVLILEDINQVIHKNQYIEGELNPINKFLSVTDGLISKYKKIIITTNIQSKQQLNQALTRPGRCFDVMSFRKLEGVEIDNLCDDCAKDLDLQLESINVSEFYAKCDDEQNSDLTQNDIGFKVISNTLNKKG
ncbi:MAG: ATP-binding protein [Campylobacterota bacterium]|nr:ATP-binding protein [Campylobacterota bacterium]